jgi:hypothetical protein
MDTSGAGRSVLRPHRAPSWAPGARKFRKALSGVKRRQVMGFRAFQGPPAPATTRGRGGQAGLRSGRRSGLTRPKGAARGPGDPVRSRRKRWPDGGGRHRGLLQDLAARISTKNQAIADPRYGFMPKPKHGQQRLTEKLESRPDSPSAGQEAGANRSDAGHDLALGQMSVAHDALVGPPWS